MSGHYDAHERQGAVAAGFGRYMPPPHRQTADTVAGPLDAYTADEQLDSLLDEYGLAGDRAETWPRGQRRRRRRAA